MNKTERKQLYKALEVFSDKFNAPLEQLISVFRGFLEEPTLATQDVLHYILMINLGKSGKFPDVLFDVVATTLIEEYEQRTEEALKAEVK